MKRKIENTSLVMQEHVNVLKTSDYRGFRLSNEKGKLEDAIEVAARSKTGVMLIAIGNSLEEAYENLIKRIDESLDMEQ